MKMSYENKELKQLCEEVRNMVREEEYEKADQKIKEEICRYPHSPIPHNLLGIVLEKEQNHDLAMKHFRAAYALEPSYAPSSYNMGIFSEFSEFGVNQSEAYDEEDCEPKYSSKKRIFLFERSRRGA